MRDEGRRVRESKKKQAHHMFSLITSRAIEPPLPSLPPLLSRRKQPYLPPRINHQLSPSPSPDPGSPTALPPRKPHDYHTTSASPFPHSLPKSCKPAKPPVLSSPSLSRPRNSPSTHAPAQPRTLPRTSNIPPSSFFPRRVPASDPR